VAGRGEPLRIFVDRRECARPRGKPFVVARDGIVRQHLRALVLHGIVRLCYDPKGVKVWDDERREAGFVVHAFLEYWPDE
jgi:hypothetical protein